MFDDINAFQECTQSNAPRTLSDYSWIVYLVHAIAMNELMICVCLFDVRDSYHDGFPVHARYL